MLSSHMWYSIKSGNWPDSDIKYSTKIHSCENSLLFFSKDSYEFHSNSAEKSSQEKCSKKNIKKEMIHSFFSLQRRDVNDTKGDGRIRRHFHCYSHPIKNHNSWLLVTKKKYFGLMLFFFFVFQEMKNIKKEMIRLDGSCEVLSF